MKKLLMIICLLAVCLTCFAQEQNEETVLEEEFTEDVAEVVTDDVDPAISEELKNIIIEKIRTFEGDKELKGFFITPTYGMEGYYDVLHKDSSKIWTLSEKTVIDFQNFNNIKELKELKKEDYADVNCLNKAIEYCNRHGISLIFSKNDDNRVFFGNGCFNFDFPSRKNDGNTLTDSQNIKIAVCPKDGAVYSYSQNTDPIISVLKNDAALDEDVSEIVKTFFTPAEVAAGELTFSVSGAYYEEDSGRLVMTCFVMGKQNSAAGIGQTDGERYQIMFNFDAYNKQLIDFQPIKADNTLPQDALDKVNKYSAAIGEEAQPDLKNIPFEPITDELLAKYTPSKYDVEFILFKSDQPAPALKGVPAEVSKMGEDIFTLKAGDKLYTFRAGSAWCFEQGKAVDMGGVCAVKDGKLEVPVSFAEKLGF